MTAAMGYAALTMALIILRMRRRDAARMLAYAAVLAGLVVMLAIQGSAGGIVAFAVWTLVSYAVLNFPVASMLYLFSAMCYILKLNGAYPYEVQVISNLAGVAGLVAIWYGRPRWEHSIDWRAWGGRAGPVAADVAAGNSRHATRQDAP